ncbi:MAG TPA: YceI family protein [Thermoanaerobaculia bacterium]|nr:YceI family protein [Thermoanaerobaculia bacterium]
MKKPAILLLSLLGFALAAFAASAERFSSTTGSAVKIEGTSTIHAWTMEGATIQGEINSPTPDNWNAPAKAVVTIPVTSIKSEHTKMDKLMAEALKAKDHPQIRYEMLEATPQNATAGAFVLKTRGRLTIAGVTKDVALDVQGVKGADGRYTLTGTAPIKMTAYGIKPPTAMLNTIKTGDDVKVTFRWVVERVEQDR